MAAKIRPAIGSGGYIAVGPIRLAVEGSGTARAMRDAGDTSSEILRSGRADTTLMMQWLARKRNSERTLRATGGLTAMITVSQWSTTSWLDDVSDTLGKRLRRSVAIAKLRGDNRIDSSSRSDELSPVTIADAISPVPMKPSLIGSRPEKMTD